MDDLISREVAAKILRARANMSVGTSKAVFYAAAGMIDKLPAVDAEPVRHGEWRRYPECGVTRCSVCDWSIEECFSSNYCPNCGAKMDAEVKA